MADTVINRATFRDVLRSCKPALGMEKVVPQLACYYFDGKYCKAFNDVLAVVMPLEFPVCGAVSGERLQRIVNTFAGEFVKVAQDKGALVVKSGKSRTTIPMLAPDAYADYEFELPQLEKRRRVLFNYECMQAIDWCLYGAGGDPIRLAAQDGVTVTRASTSGNLYFYSTDNVTMSRYIVKCESRRFPKDARTVILPIYFCKHLIDMWKTWGDEEVQMYLYEDCVVAVVNKDKYIYTKIPPREKVSSAFVEQFAKIKSVSGQKIPDNLERSLDRAQVFTGMDNATKLVCDGRVLHVITESEEGSAHDEVMFKKMIEEQVERYIDPTYMKRVLRDGLVDQLAFTKDFAVLRDSDTSFAHLIAYIASSAEAE